jgi:hypothetical protein
MEVDADAGAWSFRQIVGHHQDAIGALHWLVEWTPFGSGDGAVGYEDSLEPSSSLEGNGLGAVH